MRPNFAEMSTKELRAYVLAHREDTEALEILFSRRSDTFNPDILGHQRHPEDRVQHHQQS
jgi:hypothetical protein